jgi:hydrogenase/urease accessory protein HupE
LLLVALVVLVPSMGWAHPLALGLVELTERGGGLVAVSLRVSGTEQQGHAVTLRPPAGCALVGPMSERLGGDGWEATGRWRCPRGLRGATMTVRGLEGSEVQLIARIRLADGALTEARLDDHQRAFAVPSRVRSSTVAWSYLRMGARHIAEGADHLAFLACLALWVGRARGLVAAVTGFTAGHSVTLALAATEAVRAPSRPVEACIALSVLLLALEVARGAPAPKGAWWVAAGFGLLHGLGFASALRDIGLPRDATTTALVAFNAGVELGQVAFVGLALAAAWAARRAGVDGSRARRWVADAAGAWAVMLLLQRV